MKRRMPQPKPGTMAIVTISGTCGGFFTILRSVIPAAGRASYKSPRMAISHLKGLVYFFHKYGYWVDREKIYNWIRPISP
ncbi:MAG: hypothetical protein ACLFVS_03700 [Candidatus Acetothermia bacterium]